MFLPPRCWAAKTRIFLSDAVDVGAGRLGHGRLPEEEQIVHRLVEPRDLLQHLVDDRRLRASSGAKSSLMTVMAAAMPVSGFLISWAMPAAISPTEARRSARSICWKWRRSSSFLARIQPPHHGVEAGDQPADLVLAVGGHADREVARLDLGHVCRRSAHSGFLTNFSMTSEMASGEKDDDGEGGEDEELGELHASCFLVSTRE